MQKSDITLATTIQWQGAGNYIKDGNNIRKWDGTQLMSWYCTSIKEIKRTFGLKYADVMDWTAL